MKSKVFHPVVTYPRMGFLLLLVFLFLGTWHFLFEDDPDHLSLRSFGGSCFLEATRVGYKEVRLEEQENKSGSFLFSPICVAVLEGQGVLTQTTFQSILPEGNSLQLWVYEPTWMAWQPQAEAYEEGTSFVLDKSLVSDTTSWAVGREDKREVTTQARRSVSSLLQAPPERAVGYHAVVTQAKTGEDFVMVDEKFEEGGCNGESLTTSQTTITSLEEMMEGGTERVVVEWFLGEGCPEGERLHTATKDEL